MVTARQGFILAGSVAMLAMASDFGRQDRQSRYDSG